MLNDKMLRVKLAELSRGRYQGSDLRDRVLDLIIDHARERLLRKAKQTEYKFSYSNVALAPFNEWWEVDGRKFLLLGGKSYSIDKSIVRERCNQWLANNNHEPIHSTLFSKLLINKVPGLTVSRPMSDKGVRSWHFVIPDMLTKNNNDDLLGD